MTKYVECPQRTDKACYKQGIATRVVVYSTEQDHMHQRTGHAHKLCS